MKKNDLPKVIIIAIVILFVIPLLINLSFKIDSIHLLAAEWTAGDLLSFYGAVLGAVITLIGLAITLDYQSKQARKDDEIKYKPILKFVSLNNQSTDLIGRRKIDISFPFNPLINDKNAKLRKSVYDEETKTISHFEMILKNKGRGEATNVSLDNAVLKEVSWDEDSHLSIQQSFPISLGEILVDESVVIDITFPNYMFLNKEHLENMIFIELVISFDDIFHRNRTTLKTLSQFKITPEMGWPNPYDYKEGFRVFKVRVDFIGVRQI